MIEVESVEPDIRTLMNDYWIEDALKKHGHVITNVCGIEAAQMALEKIRAIAVANRFILDFFDDIRLEPEITELLETYNHTFDEDEMEQILRWIESTQH